jgi:hypothetical protein
MKHVRRGRATLLIMSLISFGLTALGFIETKSYLSGIGLLAIVIGSLVYTLAWMIALLDSLHAGRVGWSVALILLLPLGIGPLLYGLLGLGRTRAT